MSDQKITVKYVIAGALAVFITWLIHEFTHWLTGELYGYETIMRLNGTSIIEGKDPTELQSAIISISAPIVTVLQGFVFFWILKFRKWNKYLYPMLFTAFFMRFLAGLMNFQMLNDEGRVSEYLGIGTFTLSVIISALLFFMVYTISKKHQLNWKFQLWTVLIIMIATTILIFSDQYFGIRLL